jgi:hypothetical protein
MSKSPTSVCQVSEHEEDGFAKPRDDESGPIASLYSSGQPGEEPTSFEQILYRDFVIEGIDLVHTANTYGISNEDVLRSKERVEAWLIEERRPSRLSFEEQRAFAQKVVIERLDFVYSEAMNAWRATRDEHGVTRHPTFADRELAGKEGWTTTIARRPRGSLLWVAAKVATLLGKFQIECLDRREDAERHRADDERATDNDLPQNHPDRDCSRFSGLSASDGETAMVTAGASPVATISSSDFSEPLSGAFATQNGRLAPVQGGEKIGPKNKSPAPPPGPPRRPK